EPVVCSQGGFPINGNHINHWKKRATEAAAEITRLRAALTAAEAKGEPLIASHTEHQIEVATRAYLKHTLGDDFTGEGVIGDDQLDAMSVALSAAENANPLAELEALDPIGMGL